MLPSLLRAFAAQRLEAVLIGNAAAAMLGAPVTTIDFEFMFRDTPMNLRKLGAVARSLDAVTLRPYYPMSKLYRMVDDAPGLQADFMPVIHRVRSFECLRARSGRYVTIDSPASRREVRSRDHGRAGCAGRWPRRRGGRRHR